MTQLSVEARRGYDRARYASNPLRRAANLRASWAQKLTTRYGLTIEQYEARLAAQGGTCAVCGGINPNGQRLAVDHEHRATARLRGLLCVRCNIKIGHLEAPVSSPIEMALYLGAYL